MKFAFSIPVFQEPGSSDPFRQTYELCQAAEEYGFDLGVVGHHHFLPGYATSPFVLLAAIAARTSKLRLGTGVFLLPLHHPLEVAEQVAVLDHISNGRALLGVGIGYLTKEYEAFGVPYNRRGARLGEAIQVIRAAWTQESFSYEGRHFTIPEVQVLPKPVQQPHPPIWVGAVARRALERAAELGDGWMSDLMQTLPVEKRLADRYREACARHGRQPVVCLLRNSYVAATRQEVEEKWLPGAIESQVWYWRAGARGRDDAGLFQRLDAGEKVSLEDFARDRAIAGTPDDCIREIERYRQEIDCDYLQLSIGNVGGYEETRKSLELWGREVLPAFKE